MKKLKKILFVLLANLILIGCSQDSNKTKRPNVIIVVTDDQGFGDLGYYGNPHVQTPTLDSFAKESVRFDQFIVSPVCAPTRASLMTGRYSLRTGVKDTYRGGAIMATEEITVAEMLKEAGYTTGMVGKWHLGDNYPSRPQDQGFDYTLRHLSGGIGQPGDWPNTKKGQRSYFDPILWKNGEMFQSKGYCTDVFTEAAMDFVEANKEQPFFLYLSYNAPHAPLQVPQEYYDRYKDIDPSSGFENDGRPFPEMDEQECVAVNHSYMKVGLGFPVSGGFLPSLKVTGILKLLRPIMMYCLHWQIYAMVNCHPIELLTEKASSRCYPMKILHWTIVPFYAVG